MPAATQDRTIANVALSNLKPLPAPEEEEDDITVPVVPGTKCQHKGCNYAFVNDVVSRNEGSDEAVCRYHPMPVSNFGLLSGSSQRPISHSLEKGARLLYCNYLTLLCT